MDNFFQQGLLQVTTAPVILIAILAIALFAAQQSLYKNPIALVLFPLAITASMTFNHFVFLDLPYTEILLVTAGGIALLVTLKLKIQAASSLLLATLLGLLLGSQANPTLIPGASTQTILMTAAGILVSSGTIFLLVSLIGGTLKNLFNGIVLRVLGSWVVASSLMVFVLKIAPIN